MKENGSDLLILRVFQLSTPKPPTRFLLLVEE